MHPAPPIALRNRALLWAGLLVVMSSSGCLHAVDRYYEFDPDPEYKNPGVFVGNYSVSESAVLTPGPYIQGMPEVVQLVSKRPAYVGEAGAAAAPSDATVLIPLAIWRPECPEITITIGADPETERDERAAAHARCPPIDGVRVPIIVDAGPYFEIGQHCLIPRTPMPACPPEYIFNDTIDWPGQTTGFSLKNFLPHGYAVVQLAVRGTGTHGGCMDLMGDDEVGDLDQAITWLGEQPWSNGNVMMWGASYDGSTPWEVASTGNPYLKTIVPTSGLPDMFDLMFHNGSAETRGAVMHSTGTPVSGGVYWGYGFDDDFLSPAAIARDVEETTGPLPPPPVPLPVPVPGAPGSLVGGQANNREQYQDLQNLLCAEALNGQVTGQGSVSTGNRLSANPYWVERDHRQAILDNYEGSVFLIHGLQDWNVDPHSAIPFNLALREKGLEMKEWYGQWGHAFPDSSCTTDAPKWASMPCRLDFAEVLFRWLERELKGNMTIDVGPSIQVQDNVGQWRNAAAFPDVTAPTLPLFLTANGELANEPTGTPTAMRLMPPTSGAPAQIVELRSAPLDEDLHISGMPQLDLPFQVYGQGGQIGVWMFDEDEDGNVRAPSVCPAGSCDRHNWTAVGIPVIGHAQMNLLYYDGGEEAKPVAPGQTYTARIEFEAMEALVPAGHKLLLWVFQYAYPDHVNQQTMAPVDIILGGSASVMRVPAPDVDQTTVFPVPGSHFPNRDLMGYMYIAKPVFPPSGPGLPVAAAATSVGGSSASAPSTPTYATAACASPAGIPVIAAASTQPECRHS